MRAPPDQEPDLSQRARDAREHDVPHLLGRRIHVGSDYREHHRAYFLDVAGDSGGTSNVYASDTQYYDVTGSSSATSPTRHRSGRTSDPNPYPSNGCNDKATKICLSDAQLQAEIRLVMQANGWTAARDHLFFIFTPQASAAAPVRAALHQLLRLSLVGVGLVALCQPAVCRPGVPDLHLRLRPAPEWQQRRRNAQRHQPPAQRGDHRSVRASAGMTAPAPRTATSAPGTSDRAQRASASTTR